MKKTLTLALLGTSLSVFSLDDHNLYEVETGDSLSMILYRKFGFGQDGRPRIYGPQGVLKEVATLNEMTEESTNHIKKGTILKIPKRFEIPPKEVEAKGNRPQHVSAPIPVAIPSSEEKIEETPFQSQSWLMFQFGTYMYNRSEYSGPTTLSAERFIQPMVGFEHYFDRRHWGLSTQGYVAQFFHKDPYVPLEYQANISLRFKKGLGRIYPMIHLRYDHNYYFAGSSSDPKTVKNDSTYGGAGLYIVPQLFQKNHRIDLFVLRSLSSTSDYRGSRFNPEGFSYNVSWLMPFSKKWSLETQAQMYDLEDTDHDITQIRVFTMLGLKF